VLCQACQEKNRARIRRLSAFDEVWGAMRRALERIGEFQREFPDAAPIVEQARAALADAYPVLTKMRAQLNANNGTFEAHMNARIQQWRMIFGERGWQAGGSGAAGNTYVSPPAARTRRRLADERAQDASKGEGEE